MNDRGQTVQDYLIGIVILLLTITSVFAFFPDVFATFEDQGNSENTQLADRLSAELLEVNTTMGRERTVDFAALNATLTDRGKFGRLVNRSGIPSWKLVNVTVVAGTGDYLVTSSASGVDSVYRGDDVAATMVRTVQAHNRSHPCRDGCRAVVRVWGGQ
jgi:hypothetical protein